MSQTGAAAYHPELLKRLEHADPGPKVTSDSVDLRGKVTTRADQSEHRRYAWLYEDLLN